MVDKEKRGVVEKNGGNDHRARAGAWSAHGHLPGGGEGMAGGGNLLKLAVFWRLRHFHGLVQKSPETFRIITGTSKKKKRRNSRKRV